MSDIQQRRVDEIENWRLKAFQLSRTDRIGRLIVKTFDLIQIVVSDGPTAEILIYDLESLKTEHANVMRADANQDDIYRSLFYGLSSSLGSMIESIQERIRDTTKSQEILNPMDQENGLIEHNIWNLSDEVHDNVNNDFLSETPKIEDITLDLRDTLKNDDSAVEEGRDQDHHEIGQPVRKRLRRSISNKRYGEEAIEEFVTSSTPARGKINHCNQCKRGFATPRALKAHKRIHDGIQCGACGVLLKTEETLRKHYAENHPGKSPNVAENNAATFSSLQCTECDYYASTYFNLRVHMRTHTGEKPFACTQCPEKFRQKSNLKKHVM